MQLPAAGPGARHGAHGCYEMAGTMRVADCIPTLHTCGSTPVAIWPHSLTTITRDVRRLALPRTGHTGAGSVGTWSPRGWMMLGGGGGEVGGGGGLGGGLGGGERGGGGEGRVRVEVGGGRFGGGDRGGGEGGGGGEDAGRGRGRAKAPRGLGGGSEGGWLGGGEGD